ncbi:MAG: PQQ-dependent sugar dehydrogenase [Phycisphaerae bacterium]|nr:PQQ-dependent sugar dehydrogenase [Phycisphaerae bacterium]
MSRSLCALCAAGLAVARFAGPAFAQTVPAGYVVSNFSFNFSSPTTMAFLGPNDFLVLEKNTGQVKRVQSPGPVITTVLTLTVETASERGLLGIARHPDFSSNGYVYLYYTNPSPLENRIERYVWNGSTLVFNASIATLPATPGPNHNGGIILFGPDGKLYAVIGDLNRNDLTENFEATVLSDTAVILRLNDDGTAPGDNPLTDPGWERFYAYGIRNSFGLGFDHKTNVLWDTENGPTSFDEINRVLPGLNSGWEDLMGPDSLDPQGVGDLVMVTGAHYSDPEFSWQTPVAPTAIRFLDSCRWPASLRDDCFAADALNGRLYRFELNANRDAFVLSAPLNDLVANTGDDQSSIIWGSGFGRLTDIQIGPDGYLYLVSNGFNTIYKVRPQFPMGDINRDGIVNDTDRLRFINLLLALSTDPMEIAQGDFDGNGVVNGQDTPCFLESLFLAP